MNTFICKHRKESWTGSIFSFTNFGSHYEFLIQSRSFGIMVVFGKSSRGYFACMPDFDVGCNLANYNDVFWNTQRLSNVLGVVDGVTVACALLFLFKELEYPEF